MRSSVPQRPSTGSGGLVLGLCSAVLLGGAVLAGAAHAAPPGRRCPDPAITIDKLAGVLVLRCGPEERLRLPVSFGAEPLGHKQRSGDERTPEGHYRVCEKHRSRRFYKFLGLDYPGPKDARRGRRDGLITAAQAARIRAAHRAGRCPPWGTRLGGAIGIHGFTGGLDVLAGLWTRLSRVGELYRKLGLTDGCIALTNDAMDRLWPLVPPGTPVTIYGSEVRAPTAPHRARSEGVKTR